MPNDEETPAVLVEYTSEFKRNLRQLAKKYRQIKSDIQPLLDTLEQGGVPGDQVPNVAYEIYKARVQNSDSGKGKSGGYRILYQRSAEGAIVLVTIYSKTEQEDITPHEIRQIVLDYESQSIVAEQDGNEETPSISTSQ